MSRSYTRVQRILAAAAAAFFSSTLFVPAAFAQGTEQMRAAAALDADLALQFPPRTSPFGRSGLTPPPTPEEIAGEIPAVPDPRGELALGAGTEADRFFVHHAPDPVNAKNANLFLPLVDVVIPGPGFDLRIARAYNSRSNRVGALGWGWSFNYDVHVEKGAHGELKVVDADGFVSTFAKTNAKDAQKVVRARMARDIVNGMKSEHVEKGQVFAGEHYERIYERLVADDAYFEDSYGAYGTGLKAEDGVYWSSDRGVQKLVAAESGFVRTLSDGSGQAFDSDGRLVKVLDKNGNFLKLSYDSRSGALQSVADRAGRALKFEMNAQGRIAAVKDPIGRTIAYDYDETGNLVASRDLAGQVTRYQYDADHNLTKITYPGGASSVTRYDEAKDWVVAQYGPGPKRTVYQYGEDPKDPRRLWTAITDSLGAKTVYEYDDAANTVTKIDPLGNRSTTWYSACCGKPVKEVDALGRTTEYSYDANGDLIRVKDAAGRETKLVYEKRHGRLVARVGPDGSKLEIGYDERGNPLRVSSHGRVRAFAYDQLGNVTQVTEADGATTRIEYDDAGNPSRIVDPEGAVWTMKYDRVSRLQTVTDPRGGTTRWTFDAANRVTEVVDAAGRRTSMSYDAAGHRIAMTDARGGVTRFAHNAAGQITKVVRADGSELAYAYDAAGNVRKAVDGAGGAWSWAYDKGGRVISALDPVGGRTKYAYDAAGRLTNVVRANGGKIAYEYDDADNLVRATDPAGGVAKLAYDRSDRLLSVTNQLGAVSRIEYDAAGRVKKTVDATGRSQRFSYDSAGRRTSHIDETGKVTTYGWDKNGRLVSVRDGIADRRWMYDAGGNMLGYAETVRGRTRSVAMTYDAAGRMTSMKGPNGGIVSRTYDATNRLASVTDPSGSRTTFRYDALGRLVELTDPKLDSTTMTYDGRGNVTLVTRPDGSKLRHEYDAAGRRIASHDGKKKTRYAYDALGNTTAVTGPDGKRTALAYDTRGLLASLTPAGGKKATYAYDAAAQLVSAPVAKGARASLEYDAAGRLVKFGGRPAGHVLAGVVPASGSGLFADGDSSSRGLLPAASLAAPGSGSGAIASAATAAPGTPGLPGAPGRLSSPGRRSPLDGAQLGPVVTDGSGNASLPPPGGMGASGNGVNGVQPGGVGGGAPQPGGIGSGIGGLGGGTLNDVLGGITTTPNADGSYDVSMPVGDGGGSVFLTVGPDGVTGGGLNYSFPMGSNSATIGVGYDVDHGVFVSGGMTLPGGLGSMEVSLAQDGTVSLGGSLAIPLGNGGSLTLTPSVSFGPDGLTWDGLAELDMPGVGTFAVGFTDGEFRFADYAFGVPMPGGGILNVGGRAVNGADGFEVAGLGSMTLGGGLGNMDFVYGYGDRGPYFVSRGNLAMPMEGGGFVDIPLEIDFGPGGLSLGRNGAMNIPLGNGMFLTSNGTLANGVPMLGINDFCITCFLFEMI